MRCSTKIIVCLSLFFYMLCSGGCQYESSSRSVRNNLQLTEWQFCQDTSPEGSRLAVPLDFEWTQLSIPHVFRLSGLPEKSAGWYRLSFKAEENESGKRFWLFLEGAGSVADVFVNNQHIGQHRGAFTAAAFDMTPAIKFGQDNDLAIRVTNRDTEAANCLSQSNLYYTNGGLYRPAWLIKTSSVHIYPDMGSTGVYLTPKNISKNIANLEVKTYVKNCKSKPVDIVVRYTVSSPDGNKCAAFEAKARISAESVEPVTATADITNPKLWDIHQPNLYAVLTEVLVDGKVTDALTERTGFRKIEMKNNCFMINGKELLARGVCKHHQGEHQWNAMTDEDLLEEWKGMLDLGCNTVRLAHYPHRRFEYDIADKNGIAIWAENGLAGQKWDKGVKRETRPTADGERITREMVRQNWNHPSIVFWSSGNETYQQVASHYADIIREEDRTRLITYASAGEKPANVDFVADNTYQGWYYGHYTNFNKLPDNSFVSETGSGSWITHHIPYGTIRWKVDRFEPEEYNELVSEFRFQTIFRNNPSGHKMFLWWNFREFYNKKFKGNRNTKGIWTLAGMPKDFYYHYQSFLQPDKPVLHLCGRHHFYRQFDPNNGIKVYSNADIVELFINGISQGIEKNGEYVHSDSTIRVGNQDRDVKGPMINNVFFWKTPLKPGKNIVEARDNLGHFETMIIYQKPIDSAMLVPDDCLVVNLNSSNENNPAIFVDRPIEDQGPFYTEVDGSSDNTFDVLPEPVKGASWIATKRLSDGINKTDMSFKVTKPATVYAMFSTGTFPSYVLRQADNKIVEQATALESDLEKAGFNNTGIKGTWRGHDMWLADYALWSLSCNPGDTINIPGHVLDYVILLKAE